jgi:hypothetical protein
MIPLMKNLATVTTLAATALLLVADIEPEGEFSCVHDTQARTYAVSNNTCGPDGTVSIHLEEGDTCTFELSGAEAVGLPREGFFGSTGGLEWGTWSLMESRAAQPPAGFDGGPPPEGTTPAQIPVRHCSTERARQEERLTLRCESTSEDVPRRPDCSATLTPQ